MATESSYPRAAAACAGWLDGRGVVARFQCYRSDEPGIRWRLLGGNNRPLGIAVHSHEEHAAAIAEVELVQLTAPLASFEVEHTDAGQWWWTMTAEQDGVARSAQGFARRIDAELAAKRFRERAVDADTDPVLAVFSAGRRGRVELPRKRRSAERTTPDKPDMWPQRGSR